MNAMTAQQRKDATDAALAEILTEMNNWDVDVGPNGMSISDYIESARDQSAASDYIQILENKINTDPEYGNVRIIDVDPTNGAVTTYNPATNTYTVSFCGTRADYGEWSDNAIGLSEGSSLAQRNAAAYFDMISTKFGADANIVVSGHSKGANKAMYVTMFSKQRDRINQCIALDGQQFAKQDVADMQSHTDYEEQRAKILLIAGENDYVSQLGERIVPEDQVFYLDCSHRAANEGFSAVENDHSVKYLFENSDGQFSSELSLETNQGALGGFVRELYNTLSGELSEGEFHMVCRVLMDMMEGNINTEELLIVIGIIAPYLPDVLYHTEAGKELLQYLPVTLLSNEDMQGAEGTFKLLLCWFLSQESNSPFSIGLKTVLSYLGIGNLSSLDSILTNLANIYSKGVKAYLAIKDFLYVNFRIGAKNRYPRSAASYASESGKIKYNMDEMKNAANKLKNAANNIHYLMNAFDSDFNSRYDEIALQEAIASSGGVMGKKAIWGVGKSKLQSAAKRLKNIANTLNSICRILEEAEETAKKYGTM